MAKEEKSKRPKLTDRLKGKLYSTATEAWQRQNANEDEDAFLHPGGEEGQEILDEIARKKYYEE